MANENAAYEKIVVTITNDVPEDVADKVLAGMNSLYPTYETGGGVDKDGNVKEIKVHNTEFSLAGRPGQDRRIEHNGRLKNPLRAKMAATAKGIVWATENPA